MATRRSLPPKAPAPAPRRAAPPPRKQTLEVDVAWLEPVPARSGKSLKPPRRETIDVKLEWLEADEKRKSLRPKRVPPPLPEAPAQAAKPRRAHPPPLPREDPPDSTAPRRRSLKPPKR